MHPDRDQATQETAHNWVQTDCVAKFIPLTTFAFNQNEFSYCSGKECQMMFFDLFVSFLYFWDFILRKLLPFCRSRRVFFCAE